MAGGTGGSTITVDGAGTVRLKGSSTYAGPWTVNSGTLDVSTDPASAPVQTLPSAGACSRARSPSPASVRQSGKLFVNGGSINVDNINSLLTISGGLQQHCWRRVHQSGCGHAAGLQCADAWRQRDAQRQRRPTFYVHPGRQCVGSQLTVNVNAGHFRLLEHNQDFLQGLNIFDGGLADFTPAGTGVLQVGSLFISGSGKARPHLQQADHQERGGLHRDVERHGLHGLYGLIQSGRNGGAWNGGGIVTSSASGSLTRRLGVATAEQAGRAGGTFAGVSVAAADVLVMFTWGGDANLDGKINIDDYGQIDFNVGQVRHASSAGTTATSTTTARSTSTTTGSSTST